MTRKLKQGREFLRFLRCLWWWVKEPPFLSQDSVCVCLEMVRPVGCLVGFLDDLRKGICECRHEYIQGTSRSGSGQITVVVVHDQGAEGVSQKGELICPRQITCPRFDPISEI